MKQVRIMDRRVVRLLLKVACLLSAAVIGWSAGWLVTGRDHLNTALPPSRQSHRCIPIDIKLLGITSALQRITVPLHVSHYYLWN